MMNGRNDKNDDTTTTDVNSLLQEPLLPPSTTTPLPIPILVEVQPVPFESDLETADHDGDGIDNNDINNNNNGVDVTVNAVVVDDVIDEDGWGHGEVQTKSYCRDWFWAFLFLLQFAAVGTVAIMGIRNMIKEGSEWLPSNDDDNDHDHDGIDWNIIWFLLSIVGSVIAIAFVLLNALLGALAHMLIQISLVVSPLVFFITFIVSLVTFNVPVALFNLVLSVVGCYYACHVWHKVPFATANLNIALRAIKDNHGLWILAYGFTIKAFAWAFLWFCAVAELVIFSPSWVYDCSSSSSSSSSSRSNSNDDTNNDCRVSTQGKFIAIGMLLSLFWTSQVLKNIFHTTIAGVVGTWWFDPEEAQSASSRGNHGGCFSFSCCGCSPATYNSLYRSTVYSFGSICFGSLLVGIIQVLQFIVRCGRRQRDQQRRLRQQRRIEATDFLFCLLQYLVDSLEHLLEYINTWAFVYVGLYGYDYWTAGKEVTTLFKARGWSVIINDHLIARSLSMMSLLIGLITGLVGVLLGLVFLGPVEAVPAFFLGVILGGACCEILFGVVTSAVATVVVCFAESPNQLRINHDHELSHNLMEAWRKAYPQDCGF